MAQETSPGRGGRITWCGLSANGSVAACRIDAKGGADVAERFAWTLAAVCAAALCGCEGIAGIEDIALSSDASDVDVDASVADGSADSSAEASPTDVGAADGLADSTDGSTTAADGTLDSTAEAGLDASADQAVNNADAPAPDAASSDDSTEPDQASAQDGAADSSSPGDGSDGSAAPDATSGANDAAGGGDGTIVMDSGLQLTLIDDQQGTSPSAGWLDGTGGVKGTWFTYCDSLSSITPPADAGPAPIIGVLARDGGVSPYAAHVSGEVGDSASSSAGMGFNLNNGAAYNASSYSGFVFWGRVGPDAGTTDVRFQVTSTNTKALEFQYGSTLVFKENWAQFTVHYSDLGPPSWYTGDAGTPTFTDSAALIGCQFQLSENVTFDIWVDDVYFFVGP